MISNLGLSPWEKNIAIVALCSVSVSATASSSLRLSLSPSLPLQETTAAPLWMNRRIPQTNIKLVEKKSTTTTTTAKKKNEKNSRAKKGIRRSEGGQKEIKSGVIGGAKPTRGRTYGRTESIP